jgi:hypothetical protein
LPALNNTDEFTEYYSDMQESLGFFNSINYNMLNFNESFKFNHSTGYLNGKNILSNIMKNNADEDPEIFELTSNIFRSDFENKFDSENFFDIKRLNGDLEIPTMFGYIYEDSEDLNYLDSFISNIDDTYIHKITPEYIDLTEMSIFDEYVEQAFDDNLEIFFSKFNDNFEEINYDYNLNYNDNLSEQCIIKNNILNNHYNTNFNKFLNIKKFKNNILLKTNKNLKIIYENNSKYLKNFYNTVNKNNFLLENFI